MRRLGLLDKADTESLRATGAVGDFCAHLIDVHGKVVDHPVNRRVLALAVDDLRDVPTVILASGGQDKLKVLHAALSLKTVTIFVTDETTAHHLLANDLGD